MSEIPYYFNAPIPAYFQDNGYLSKQNCFKFLHWAFSRCSTRPHSTLLSGKLVNLAPFEFVAGRSKSAIECFLTDQEFKYQVERWQKLGLLKKTANSVTNHYSCYIWVVEAFSRKTANHTTTKPPTNRQPIDDQLLPDDESTEYFLSYEQQENDNKTANQPPTDRHNTRERDKRYKEEQPPSPFLPDPSDEQVVVSLSHKKKKQAKFEIYKDVFLTADELAACVSARGSHEEVVQVAEQIQAWPGRQFDITDWVTLICKWQLKSERADHLAQTIAENEAFAKKYEERYSSGSPWRCYIYHDKNKDARGLLFECCQGQGILPIFLVFSDAEFQEKASKLLMEKKMQLSRIPKPNL